MVTSTELFAKIEELKLEVVEGIKNKCEDLFPNLSSAEKLNLNCESLGKEIDDLHLKIQSEVYILQ